MGTGHQARKTRAKNKDYKKSTLWCVASRREAEVPALSPFRPSTAATRAVTHGALRPVCRTPAAGRRSSPRPPSPPCLPPFPRRSLKRRAKDVDQIQDEMKALAEGNRTLVTLYADVDAPGGGLHACVVCSRHFISEAVLAEHCRTKPHKKRVKEVAQPQYTQKEADAGAGVTG